MGDAVMVGPEPRVRLSQRTAIWLALGVWVVGLGLRVLQLWWWSSLPSPLPTTFWLTLLAAVTFGTIAATVGVLIVAQRPDNGVGWIFVLAGLLQGSLGAASSYAANLLQSGPETVGLALAWAASLGIQALPLTLFTFLVAVFPDGHFLSPRWRIIGVLAIAGLALRSLELTFGAPEFVIFMGDTSARNPLLSTSTFGRAMTTSFEAGLGIHLLQVAVLLALVELLIRYWRSEGDVRRQLRWFLMAGLLVLLASIPLAIEASRAGAIRSDSTALTLFFAAICLAPIATFIAITRYHLYEIDHIINRAVLYGSLTAILAGLFTAAIALAQRAFVAATGERSDAAVVITTLVVATAYTPIRKRLETAVDRRFKWETDRFGAYRDELGHVLDTRDPERALGRLLAEGVRELDAGWGQAESRRGDRLEIVRAIGVRPAGAEPAIRVQVATPARTFGVLAFGPRANGRPYDPRAEADLRSVAALAARAIDASAPG